MTRAISVSDDTRSRQARAADPKASIWVEANAGSGKTHVLVDRVLRLLLSGVKPEEILCLTYTKAAAAEMRRRVSARLADWALRDSAALDEALQDLEQRPSSAALRHRARTLFAHALETPGGLKIVTIHAFCESILHRFPLEAGVPFDFTVIEEDEKTRMVIEAREAVLAGGLNGDTRLADAVATLFALLSDTQITTAIEIALADARKLRPVLADRDGAKARLRGFSFYSGETSAALHDEMLAGRLLGPVEIAAMLAIVAPKSHGTRFEDKLARLDADHPMPQHLLKTFLTGEHEVPKGFPGKALARADPGLAALCLAEARRLEDLAGRLRHATLIERSEALLDVLGAISDRFEAKKRARSLLDFDDLIARVHALFDNPALGPWVQYKHT